MYVVWQYYVQSPVRLCNCVQSNAWKVHQYYYSQQEADAYVAAQQSPNKYQVLPQVSER